MRYLLIIISALCILCSFSSCAVINSVLGLNKCAVEGCDRECVNDCNYCIIHCDTHTIPDGFNKKAAKSIDDQVNKYNSNLDQKKK